MNSSDYKIRNVYFDYCCIGGVQQWGSYMHNQLMVLNEVFAGFICDSVLKRMGGVCSIFGRRSMKKLFFFRVNLFLICELFLKIVKVGIILMIKSYANFSMFKICIMEFDLKGLFRSLVCSIVLFGWKYHCVF